MKGFKITQTYLKPWQLDLLFQPGLIATKVKERDITLSMYYSQPADEIQCIVFEMKTKGSDINDVVYVVPLPKKAQTFLLYYSLAFFKFSQIAGGF